jgi:hypothetical protein
VILDFICGCKHEINTADQEDVGWWLETSTDREGFLVCTKHRVRRKFWNSLPEEASRRLKYQFSAYSPLQREKHEVFGKPFTEYTPAFDFNGDDRRDNRDPETIGKEILAKIAAKQNGEQRRHPEINDTGEFGA